MAGMWFAGGVDAPIVKAAEHCRYALTLEHEVFGNGARWFEHL